MTPDTDPILAALGGNITAARSTVTIHRKFPGMAAGDQLAAICDLAMRALDAMERPAGGDARLRRLRADLKSCIPAIQALHDKFLPGGIFAGNKDAAMRMVEEMTRVNQLCGIIEMIDRLLSEPDPASDGRTGSCAECERLNADVLAYRRKERKILGLPDEALAEDHIDAITSLKNAKDGWEAECEMQRVTKERIIAERDEANRDARNAADMMMTANNEAVRYMRERDEALAECEQLAKAHDELGKQAVACERDRCVQADEIATLTRERDAARADQAAMARRELEAFGSDALNLRALPADAPVQVVRDIIAEKLRAHIADLPAENGEQDAVKPAEPANPPASPAAGDWPEDGCHENGAYHCACIACGATFIGHKRRVVCKVCSEKTANPPASPDGSTADAEARIAEFVEKVNKAINAMCDPTSPNFARGPVEVRAGMDAIRERTVVTLRSLAADNAKAQAEVERLTNLLDDTSNEAATLRDDLETAQRTRDEAIDMCDSMSAEAARKTRTLTVTQTGEHFCATQCEERKAMAAKLAEAETDVGECRRAYSAHWVGGYATARECMAAAIDSAMILRGKIAEAEAAKPDAGDGGRAMREACRRIAVRRMTSWTKDDDKRSQDFREGIEQAASDIACAISSLAPPDLDEDPRKTIPDAQDGGAFDRQQAAQEVFDEQLGDGFDAQDGDVVLRGYLEGQYSDWTSEQALAELCRRALRGGGK